jgi:hypothetical protein
MHAGVTSGEMGGGVKENVEKGESSWLFMKFTVFLSGFFRLLFLR